MHTRSIKLASFALPLMAALSGCGPDTPKQASSQERMPPVSAAPAPAGPSGSGVVSREEFTRLAKDIGCFACHSIDKKLLGPAWRTVGQVNRGRPDAEERLIAKISKGGGGVWGSIEMPGYPALDVETKRTLIRYILSLQ